jgi:hypothetical protein
MCSLTKKLQIVRGTLNDYKQLANYHYRDGRIGPFAAVFALKPTALLPLVPYGRALGVIVYRMPTAGLELRNAATGGVFAGFDRNTQLALINRNIRTISRVIIDPLLRGLGLATRLVRETMPQMNIPIVEALAVMGTVNPFFQKAGMKAFTAPLHERCVTLIEALSAVGIEKKELLDAMLVQKKLAALRWPAADFIEGQIKKFLQSYGRRKDMPPGLERTRYMLSKLTERPTYYIWFNQKLAFSV